MGKILLGAVSQAVSSEIAGHFEAGSDSDMQKISEAVARVAIDVIKMAPDQVIEAMMEWTPTPYETGRDKEAYRLMLRAALDV
jgi:hypothetical protein